MAKLEPIKSDDLNLNLNYTNEQMEFLNKYKSKLGNLLPPCFEDADFLSRFMVAVDKSDYNSFVINTSKFLNGDKTANPKFVLVFRRTTLKEDAKPEVFWTNEYGVVRNGLKKEIPPHTEHRILSKIFVTTLSKLNNNKQSQEECEHIDRKYGVGSSDGEIRISQKPFDLRKYCLFAIKPESEKKELNEFLERNGLQQ